MHSNKPLVLIVLSFAHIGFSRPSNYRSDDASHGQGQQHPLGSTSDSAARPSLRGVGIAGGEVGRDVFKDSLPDGRSIPCAETQVQSMEETQTSKQGHSKGFPSMSSVVDSSSHATLQKRSTASVHEKVKVTQAKRRLPKRTVPLESFNSGQLAEIMFNSFELVRGYKLGGIQFNWCQVICFAAHASANPGVWAAGEFGIAQAVRRCQQICDDQNSSDPGLKANFEYASIQIGHKYSAYEKKRSKYPQGREGLEEMIRKEAKEKKKNKKANNKGFGPNKSEPDKSTSIQLGTLQNPSHFKPASPVFSKGGAGAVGLTAAAAAGASIAATPGVLQGAWNSIAGAAGKVLPWVWSGGPGMRSGLQ